MLVMVMPGGQNTLAAEPSLTATLPLEDSGAHLQQQPKQVMIGQRQLRARCDADADEQSLAQM